LFWLSFRVIVYRFVWYSEMNGILSIQERANTKGKHSNNCI